MRAGQVRRICLEAAHQIVRIALLLFMLGLAALGLFAFALSRHPLEIPHLASRLATEASGNGITVHVARAELAWRGYEQGGGVPLVLRLRDIAVYNGAGTLLVTVPKAIVVAPPEDLFGGHAAISLRAKEARLAGTQAPVTIRSKLWPGDGFTLVRGEFHVSIGPGVLGYGGSTVPISGASFTMRTGPGTVEIPDGTASLAPIGGSAPHATFSFTARRDTAWTGSLHATVDAVRAQELGHYWPANAIPATRDWVVKHITQGRAQDADFTFSFAAPGDLSGLHLVNVSGGFVGKGLTLYWLSDFMPITGLDGQFTMPHKNDVVITSSAGQEGNVVLRQGRMDITGVSAKDQTGVLKLDVAGGIPDVMAVLNAPPLALLKHAPPLLASATGQAEGKITITIPFEHDLTFDKIHLQVAAKLHDMAIPALLPPLGARHGEVLLQTDGHMLTAQATAELAGEPASATLTEQFAGAGTVDLQLRGVAGPQIFHWLALDGASDLNEPATGTAPFSVHLTGSATGTQTAVLNADLTPTALALPLFVWRKKAGESGSFALTARLQNGTFSAVERFAAQGPGLDIEAVAQDNGLAFSMVRIGRTQASGSFTRSGPDGPWIADFSGPVLDIRQPKQTHATVPPAASGASTPVPAPVSGPHWQARFKFARLYLAPAPAPALTGFTFAATGQGRTMLTAQAAAAGLDINVTPEAAGRSKVLMHAADAGVLLRSLGKYDKLQGGTLTLRADYGAGLPARGQLTLLDARVADAPEVTKVLEGLTLYGLADATSGPGLKISRVEVPFSLEGGILTLHEARAFSSSLGFTASGSFDLVGNVCDLDTTIVPLYALNALPGKIPFLGRLFSPEKGGGLIAMRAHISGPLDDTKVSINPLSALTPGFLRSIFGLGTLKK